MSIPGIPEQHSARFHEDHGGGRGLLIDLTRLDAAYQIALATLLAERTSEGYWIGELSTSALSTAVAASALALVQKAVVPGKYDALIRGGIAWLAAHQNEDGGWGDTVKSFSNISTTMLCRAAFHLTRTTADYHETLQRAEKHLADRYGRAPSEVAEAVRRRYGKDRTFSVPILMTSALAGLISWNEVPSLPFELACFPQAWFRYLQLPVVSYALPALIAIGQAVFHHRRPWDPFRRIVRRLAINKSLRVLETIQPSNGGFLEAAPLTSFVALGLASTGRANHPVVAKCVEFLVQSVRPDGSWPIDTNLSTWVTTLSVNALAAADDLDKLETGHVSIEEVIRAGGVSEHVLTQHDDLHGWLLSQQFTTRHPYTGAAPGGWAWTNLPGGVPDADDTSGALLALANLRYSPVPFFREGIQWLLGLQNRDGGCPTFCRGWGNLPFDRSGADLTAHAIRAIHNCAGLTNSGSFAERCLFHNSRFEYLARIQQPDGSWLPLWFGNQHAPDDVNPTYGTARVLAAYRDLDRMNDEPARRGIAFLLSIQNADGGWGGAAHTPSSIEETALACEILLDAPPELAASAVNKGLAWLVEQVEMGRLADATPIGFYFAKLWYFEKLYPIIFTVAALGRARRKLAPRPT